MHVYVYMYIFIYIYISYINTRVFCAATGDTCFGWCLVAWITQPNSMQQHYNVSPCKHIMLQNQIPHCQHLLGSLIFCMEVFRGMSWLLHFSVLFICFSGCFFFGGSPALEGLVDHHLPTPLLDHHLPLHCSLHWVQKKRLYKRRLCLHISLCFGLLGLVARMMSINCSNAFLPSLCPGSLTAPCL